MRNICNNTHIGLLIWLVLVPLWSIGQTETVDKDQQEANHRLSQEQQIEQLKQDLENDSAPNANTKTLRKLVGLYMNISLDSALVFAQKELALAQIRKDPSAQGIARLNLAGVFFQMTSVDTALSLLLTNRDEKALYNDSLIAATETALSVIYTALGKYENAIEAGFNAIEVFEMANDSTNAGFNYISLSEVYLWGLKDQEKGLECIRKAIMLLRAKNAPPNYLIGALTRYGDVCTQIKEYNRAEAKFKEALELSLAKNDYWYLSDSYCGLGKVYYHQGHYAKSIQYLEKALEKSDSLEHRMARIYRYLGLNHRASGQLQKAIAYFELCLPMEKSLKNQISIEEFLVDCHSQLSNYLKAFEYQRQVTQHQDSLHAREQEKRITEVVEKYENEQKTMKIEKLNTENRHKGEVISQQKLNFGIALALLLLLGAGGFLWIRFRQKLQEGINQLEKNQLQQRFLRVQLNPHFLFHALSSIESYIYTNEKESAAAFLRNFSKLMRNILETSDQDFVSLENDLDTMREYLMMQQLNSDFKFEYDITVDENLNLQTLQVPPMLIQPFIENAILHGALQVKNGTVAIHYLSTARHLQIRIKDNGPGLTSGEHRSGSLWRSMGMEIVQQRIQNLEKSHGLHIQYRIAANEGQKGTIVVLDVPIRQVSAA